MIQSSLSQQDLLFFVTLCRLQSLTVSAQKLNLSLSSACRMLTHLRETFGEPLFVRSRSGLMPTPGAMALLPKAIMLLDGCSSLPSSIPRRPSASSASPAQTSARFRFSRR